MEENIGEYMGDTLLETSFVNKTLQANNKIKKQTLTTSKLKQKLTISILGRIPQVTLVETGDYEKIFAVFKTNESSISKTKNCKNKLKV